MPADRIWMSKHNARCYYEYAVRYPCFTETSKKLVKLLKVRPPATVVDLACGTGQTAAALLAAVPSGIDLVLVDMSPAMLSFARKALPRDNCTFMQGRGEELERLLQGRKAQYVICNRAIWHMDMSQVLAGVNQVLAQGGRFAFNTFAGRLDLLPGKSPYDAIFHIARRKCKSAPRPQPQGLESSADELAPLLAGTALRVLRRKREYLMMSSQQIFELLKIPTMSEAILPGLDHNARHEIVCAAERYFGGDRTASVEAWEFTVLEKARKPQRSRPRKGLTRLR